MNAIVTKGVVRDGRIELNEPISLPDGSEVVVTSANGEDAISTEEIDRDFAVLDSLCATSERTDEEQLEFALQEARQQAKDRVRRQMSLP